SYKPVSIIIDGKTIPLVNYKIYSRNLSMLEEIKLGEYNHLEFTFVSDKKIRIHVNEYTNEDLMLLINICRQRSSLKVELSKNLNQYLPDSI
ncbi:MAG: hypothetical protein HYZ42_06470, partial [Bacteroidetes bacterium]|nr:hypothetical protein [Bacteroidota bacterium]